MPVVFLVTKPLSPPWNDGTKMMVKEIIRHLPEFTFRGFSHDGERLGENFFPLRMSPSPIATGKSLLQAALSSDLIHFVFTPRLFTVMASILLSRMTGRPSLFTVTSHASSIPLPLLRFMSLCTALSTHSLLRLKKRGVQEAVLIRPGIPNPGKRNERKKERLVLYPGDMEFSGGEGVVVEAAQRLSLEMPEVKFLFAYRRKTKKSERMAESLRQQIADKGLSRYCEVAGDGDMKRLLPMASVVVFPARSLFARMEVPLILLEAMGMGIPLIVSDLPSLSEAVDGAGMVIPRGEASFELAGSIKRILGNEALAHEMGRAEIRVWEERFCASKMAEGYRRVYGLLSR